MILVCIDYTVTVLLSYVQFTQTYGILLKTLQVSYFNQICPHRLCRDCIPSWCHMGFLQPAYFGFHQQTKDIISSNVNDSETQVTIRKRYHKCFISFPCMPLKNEQRLYFATHITYTYYALIFYKNSVRRDAFKYQSDVGPPLKDRTAAHEAGNTGWGRCESRPASSSLPVAALGYDVTCAPFGFYSNQLP